MLKRTAVTGCTMIGLAVGARASSPVSATLTVTPPTVLPGLPSAFLITLTNASNQQQTVFNAVPLTAAAGGATLQITGVNGETGLTLPSDQLERCADDNRCLTVPPLGQRELYIDFEPSLIGNEFFFDRRLSTPGTYKLQLTLQSSFDGSDVTITTNEAPLTVQQPAGVDAEAWNWLNGVVEGGWSSFNWGISGDRVAGELRARFASSGYVIWVAWLGASTMTEQLANIEAAIASNPQGGLRDALLWAKGSLLAQWNGIAIYSERDLQHALALADAATSVLTTLRDTGLASFSRDRAAAAIAHLYTTKTGEATLRLLAASDPPAPERIVPRVECVERGTGTSFSARFA